MKSALTKEFYSWLNTRSIYIGIQLAISVICVITSNSTDVITYIMILIMATICGSFAQDAKSSWDVYSRALPVKPWHWVAAKYITAFTEILLSAIISSVTFILVMKRVSDGLSAEDGFGFDTVTDRSVYGLVLMAFVAVVCMSISLFVNYFSGGKRWAAVLGTVPFALVVFIAWLFTSLIFIFDKLAKIFETEAWLYAAMAAVAIMSVAASFMGSVVVRTHNGKEKMKAVKAVAIILAVLSVAVIAGSFVKLDKNGWFKTDDIGTILGGTLDLDEIGEVFEPETTTVQYNPGDGKDHSVLTAQQKANLAESAELVGFLSKQENIGKPFDEVKAMFEENGYSELTCFEADIITYLYNKNAESITVYIEKDAEDTVKSVKFSTDTGENYIEKLDQAGLDELMNSRMKIGMTESEALEIMQEYGMNIDVFEEYERLSSAVPTKMYRSTCYIQEYLDQGATKVKFNLRVANSTVINFSYAVQDW